MHSRTKSRCGEEAVMAEDSLEDMSQPDRPYKHARIPPGPSPAGRETLPRTARRSLNLQYFFAGRSKCQALLRFFPPGFFSALTGKRSAGTGIEQGSSLPVGSIDPITQGGFRTAAARDAAPLRARAIPPRRSTWSSRCDADAGEVAAVRPTPAPTALLRAGRRRRCRRPGDTVCIQAAGAFIRRREVPGGFFR